MRHVLIILLLLLSPAVHHASAAGVGASPAQEAFDSVFSADVQRVKAGRDPKAVVELAARMLATARESKSQRNSEGTIIFSWPLPFPRRSVNGKSVLCPQIIIGGANNAFSLVHVSYDATATQSVWVAGHSVTPDYQRNVVQEDANFDPVPYSVTDTPAGD